MSIDLTLPISSSTGKEKTKTDTWKVFQTLFTWALVAAIAGVFFYITFLYVPFISKVNEPARVFPNWPDMNVALRSFHIVTAMFPLAIGLYGFSKSSRKRSMKMHRWLGTIYCVSIWMSAVVGFALAVATDKGLPAAAGFGLLAIVWFTTTTMAYIYARRKDIVTHRRWMIRSFAITLAVVTVKPLFFFAPASIDPVVWYQIVTWCCWVPNMILGEIYLRVTKHSGKLAVANSPKTSPAI